jgi:hypothetical protein
MEPFETNQPLEQYRLRSGLGVAAFAAELGVAEGEYIGLVTGDDALPEGRKLEIARRLNVSPWLINECTPPPSAEQLAAITEAVAEARVNGWAVADQEAFEAAGERWFEDLDEQDDKAPPPMEHTRRADALLRLEGVHRGGDDADYQRLRGILDGSIRALAGREGDGAFDAVAWARETLGMPEWLDDNAGAA